MPKIKRRLDKPTDQWVRKYPTAAALLEVAEALNRIAEAQERAADAAYLLARATAGEFDNPEEVPGPPQKGQGMGMGS